MTSLNTYFDAIKPFAKSIQEKATKLTDVLDEKLKKTQENLEKQRIKAVEASESEALPRLWRSSNEHPLGEIVVIPPPVPITPPSIPVIQEKSRTLTVIPESKTVKRKRSPRSRIINDSENDNEQKQQINHCPNNIINEIIEKEDIEKCLNQLIDMVIAMDDFIEKTSITTISTEDNAIIVEDSLDSINTNEENSESFEIQSNIIETDLSDSMNSSFKKFDLCETIEEHFVTDTFESSIQQTNTPDTTSISELVDSSVIDTREESLTESLPASSNVIDPPIDEVPQKSITTIIKKEKRFSLVNSYSIPSNIIVSHMSCSSTHIYICTNQQSLYYAEVPENNFYHSLQWYCYTLPAERVIVSHSNQTIWRIFNKSIYSSSDTVKLSPLGIHWTELTFSQGQTLLSISINDQYGWYIKEDGTLWLIRINDEEQKSLNVNCPFNLNHVVCSIDKIGVTTNDSQILIRIGCTNDCPGGDGWIFIEHNFGPFDDFTLITDNTMLCIIDKKHRIWIHDWSSNGKFHEVLRNDEYILKPNINQYLIDINEKFLCFTDCHEQLFIFSNCLTGIHWSLVQKNTRLQRLIGAFPNENYVWALTTDGMICSSNGQNLDKPRQAQYLTHASFVPTINSQNTILWSLDESCNIYIRNNVDQSSQWEQLDQSQFEWNRRLVHIVCNTVGVWAVDDHGCIHFRYGHISNSNEFSVLNPAWIPIPGEPEYNRSFAHIFCGPEKWMVYATDNKQTVYARTDIDENNHMGTSWKVIEDCSALQLAISEHTLWLLTSHGRIQCRENISLTNPIGTRSTTLPGRFNSIIVSTDDNQIWALYPPHHLFKLDRLTTLFEK